MLSNTKIKTRMKKMSRVTLEQLESILEDIVPDEESAEAFGVSYVSLDQSSHLKISCSKIQDSDRVVFVWAAERFERMFYFYQC